MLNYKSWTSQKLSQLCPIFSDWQWVQKYQIIIRMFSDSILFQKHQNWAIRKNPKKCSKVSINIYTNESGYLKVRLFERVELLKRIGLFEKVRLAEKVGLSEKNLVETSWSIRNESSYSKESDYSTESEIRDRITRKNPNEAGESQATRTSWLRMYWRYICSPDIFRPGLTNFGQHRKETSAGNYRNNYGRTSKPNIQFSWRKFLECY